VRVQDEETCEAEYWDEYLREFGRAAYIEARYQAQRAVELEPGAYDSDDLDRIHSLSHERVRGGSRGEIRRKAEQKRDSRRSLVDGQRTRSGEDGRAPRAQHPERKPYCRRTPVGWLPRNVGPNAAFIRTPADDGRPVPRR
jgi:hypothetical protein